MLQSGLQSGEGLPSKATPKTNNRSRRNPSPHSDREELGQFRELIDLKKGWETAQKVWSKSLAVIIALIVGVLTGSVYSKNEILGDCSFNNSFRVNSQAFTCQRKI
jgi:hypothetical protein